MALIPIEKKIAIDKKIMSTKFDKIQTWDDLYLLIYDIMQFIYTQKEQPIEKKEFN